MITHTTTSAALEACFASRRFSLCHLYREERPIDMHLHDCFEIYYTISGGLQFLIEDRIHDMHPGDIFFINKDKPHHVLANESGPLERLVIFIHPDFIQQISTDRTDLVNIYLHAPKSTPFRYCLNESQQRTFLYHINQLQSAEGFGSDILETCRMAELLLYLNQLVYHYVYPDRIPGHETADSRLSRYMPQVQDALLYINSHIQENISLSALAEHLFLSESYLCRIFKASTGTTISKYIVGRRIAIAKSLLSSGFSVAESQERSGFSDYSNFLKAFTKAVGMSPKKYAQLAHTSSQIESPSTVH